MTYVVKFLRDGTKRVNRQMYFIMVPCDLKFKTWYLNKARLRTWDHLPNVVNIEGQELKMVQGKKGWKDGFPGHTKEN